MICAAAGCKVVPNLSRTEVISDVRDLADVVLKVEESILDDVR